MRQIGEIQNGYGALHTQKEDDKCLWWITCIMGENEEEIPQYLYDALNRFQDEQEAKEAEEAKPKVCPHTNRGSEVNNVALCRDCPKIVKKVEGVWVVDVVENENYEKWLLKKRNEQEAKE